MDPPDLQSRSVERAPPSRASISTDALRPQDREAFGREELSNVLEMEVEPLADSPPRYKLSYSPAGPVGFFNIEGSPTRYIRSRRHVQNSDDDFTFVLLDSGRQELLHNGGAIRTDPGQSYMIHRGSPHDSLMPDGGTSFRGVRIKADALRALVRNPERAAGRNIEGVGTTLALLRGYVRAFSLTEEGLPPEVLQSFGLHVVDMVAAIIGATRDGAAQAAEGGIKAARLRELLSAIAAHACEPNFSVDVVASQLAVTGRYINRLLEETGNTFQEHVVEHRLRRAWLLLSDPNCILKVASVAFDCGFNDLSHFNRAFRRRFGNTPTSVRGSAVTLIPDVPHAISGASTLVAGITPLLSDGADPIPQRNTRLSDGSMFPEPGA